MSLPKLFRECVKPQRHTTPLLSDRYKRTASASSLRASSLPTVSQETNRFLCSAEALRISYSYAQRLGLHGEAAEDCALDFVNRVLTDVKESALRPPQERHLPGLYSEPWLRRCAYNHASNFSRSLRLTRQHERLWCEIVPVEDQEMAWDCPDTKPSLEFTLLRSTCWTQVMLLVNRLSPTPRVLFLRHHLEGESIAALAEWSGRTPHAVEQTLLRARKRLQELLCSQGLDESELRLRICV